MASKGPVYKRLQQFGAGEEEATGEGVPRNRRWIKIGVIAAATIVVVMVVLAGVAAGVAVGITQLKGSSSGTDTPSSGTDTPSSGTDTPSSGTATPSSGTATPSSGTATPSPGTPTTPSPQLYALANTVKSRMHTYVNPCSDFYAFACGGFDSTAASEDYITYSTFGEAIESVQVDIKGLLGSHFSNEGVAALQKVKDLYDSCMDTSAINSRGVQPLRDIIRKTGGWSLVDIPNEEGQYPSWDINGPQFQMEKLLGSPAFFYIGVGIDPEDSSTYILEIVQSGLSFPTPQFYTDPEYGYAFRQVLEDTIESTLQQLSFGFYSSVASDIVDFEEDLARIHVSITDLSDVEQSTNIMTIADLSSNYPYYSWAEAIQGFLRTVGITVDTTERINVLTPSYFSALSNKLRFTSSSTLRNYAKWHLTRVFTPALDEESLTAFKLLKEKTTGKRASDEDRAETCIGVVEQILPMALARSYAEHVLPQGLRAQVSTMIEELKVALKERIDTRDWLDDYSRQQSMEKVDALAEWVGYPNAIFNDAFLNGLYAQYYISRSDYFNNYLQYVNISIRSNFANLHQPVNRTLFLAQAGSAPTQVNAFYFPPLNQIVILMGIMNSFFQVGWPEYYAYGALGAAIGHEMVHGFDNHGRLYDPLGNYRQWWSNSSIQNYEDRQQCFVNQYSGYSKFGRYVNGRQTLGENIADNGGIEASFQAYKNVLNGTEPSPLPGLSYTPDQLFFIAWAQDWCTYFDSSQGEVYFTVSTWADVHSPGPFRVTGPLVNNPDFAQAFNCPVGSTMNPTNKCLLW